jgi:cbb3-type cytochrome oxidase subunit 3
MSKIVSRLLENVTWLDELSGILTVFFFILFTVIVVVVLRLKKEQVDEYKNLPLSDDDTDIFN